MKNTDLRKLKKDVGRIKERYIRGQVDAPDFLVAEMMEGVIDTLIEVGFNDPQIRREPFVERITGAFKAILDPETQRVARNLLVILFEHGFRLRGKV